MKVLPKVSKGVLAAFACAWGVYVALQRGDPYDEAEHAHAAWLIASQGQTPFVDFFQHHQSLLWDLLGMYFLLGGDGPQVTYFGRGIAVACALAWIAGGVLLASSFRPGALPVLATAWLAAVTAFAPTLLVIRPETLGVAVLPLSLGLWVLSARREGRESVLLAAAAAGLFAVACLASVRFAVLGPFFVLFDVLPVTRKHVRRWGALAVGFWAVFGVYMAVSPFRWQDLWFCLDFYGVLRGVGGGHDQWLGVMIAVASVSVGIAAVLGGLLPREERLRWAAMTAYLVALYALSFTSGGGYYYVQNLTAPILGFGLMAAFGEARLGERLGDRWSIVAVVVLVAAAGCLALPLRGMSETSIVDVTATRQRIGELVGPDGTIVASAAVHPIDVPDATFYVTPLTDSPDRLCVAVRAMDPSWGLPPCDYAVDLIQRQPTVIGMPFYTGVIPPDQRETLDAQLSQTYYLLEDFLVHGDRAAEGPP